MATMRNNKRFHVTNTNYYLEFIAKSTNLKAGLFLSKLPETNFEKIKILKKMASEDWVFDSLVCFLHGPVWNAPLQTFIEEKSIVFDPNLQTDEHNPEVQRIYGEYKNLVDFMLGSYMEEMQITAEQFESACMEGRQQQDGNPFNLHQGLFQQIWAANDIKMFVRMMTQRNIELQLQALDLIEKNQLALLQEGELLENDATDATSTEKNAGVEDDCQHKLIDVEQLIANSVEHQLKSPDAARTPAQETFETDVLDKFQRLNLFFEKNPQVDPDDVQSRQAYLRQQRDKILDIKKKTRTKQLLETMSRNKSNVNNPTSASRPSSAQVAQRILEGRELLQGDGEQETNAMQLRKTLAKRLRSEVVEQQ